jgi:hypothetical protein
MAMYERGSVRIHYQEAGSGFPLFVIPGGGQNSTIGFMADRAPSPWKDAKEKIPLAVRPVRTFLKAHRPA